MIRRLFILLLSLSVTANASVTAYDPAALARLVDEYVNAMTSDDKDEFTSMAKGEYYALQIGRQIARLEPDDFNKFSLDLVGRYLANPGERKAIGQFIHGMRAAIAEDLKRTKMLESGPADYVSYGMGWYGTAVLLAGFVLRRGLSAGVNLKPTWYFSPIRNVGMGLDKADLAIAQMPRTRRFMVYTTTRMIAPGAIGAGIGYLQYALEANKTHRLDPEEDLLNVAQVNLACDLSYRALDLEDLLNEPDPAKLDKDYARNSAEAKALIEETTLLLEQWPRLDNLETEDRMLAKKLRHLPPAPNFQALRKNLTETIGNRDNHTCQAVSLTHLKAQAQEQLLKFEFVHQQLTPEEKK